MLHLYAAITDGFFITSTYFAIVTEYISQVRVVLKAFISYMHSANMIEARKLYDH